MTNATAVLFMYNPVTGKTSTDVFSTPDYSDPVRTAENLKASCEDDFPGAFWSISANEEARDIMVNTRMREMGFEDYDHATMKRSDSDASL